MNGFHKTYSCFLFCSSILNCTSGLFPAKARIYIFLSRQNHWVDSVYKKLSKKQRVAQLFFVRAHTDLGQAYEDSVGSDQGPAGRWPGIFPGRPGTAGRIDQHLSETGQSAFADREGWRMGPGHAVGFDHILPLPNDLGAIQDNSLIYKMGQFVAYDFKRLGMQINLAPDMDVNNNPNNPVINYRSFGDNKYNVAAKGIAYMKGMQDGGL